VAQAASEDAKLDTQISRAVTERHIINEIRAFDARERREWLNREARALFTSGF
jgi:hypothetical protein